MSAQLFRVPPSESNSDLAVRKLPHFLRVEEVADLLRCKKRTIYDMVEQRRIPIAESVDGCCLISPRSLSSQRRAKSLAFRSPPLI
jgi:hypothetical protein